jgi:hypothetical protein
MDRAAVESSLNSRISELSADRQLLALENSGWRVRRAIEAILRAAFQGAESITHSVGEVDRNSDGLFALLVIDMNMDMH